MCRQTRCFKKIVAYPQNGIGYGRAKKMVVGLIKHPQTCACTVRWICYEVVVGMRVALVMVLATLICLHQTHTRPGYITGVVYMAQWIYPAIFADLDPYSIHQHLERFRGMGMPDKDLCVSGE